jgi:type I restriction enzyme R subunit
MEPSTGRLIISTPTEADTCRKFVVPKLQASGWENDPHSIAEQRQFTDGRIVVAGNNAKRLKRKKADYLLRYSADVTLAVVEAKAEYKSASDGLQQAKEYALMLGLSFAYATNGKEIIEYDFATGIEREVVEFPTPAQLWERFTQSSALTSDQAAHVLTPYNVQAGRRPRYYQDIAIRRAVQAVVQGKPRNLLTLATGTGKTQVSFQICWKLWASGWNRTGRVGKPRILFLADRNVLVDKPFEEEFAPFGDARWKITGGEANKSRQMYFAIYQAIAGDHHSSGLFQQFSQDFFDLIIVDECHRGSAAEGGNWREILQHFGPAIQIGMTATPKRQDNVDTYKYFGDPLYQYSLRQGIEDGFLAPYRVHRVLTTVDAVGWRPADGETDRYERVVPDQLYTTPNFERDVVLKKRTEAIAKHLSKFVRDSDPFGKTIVFCVDQEHAEAMRASIARANPDLMRQHPDYVSRIVSDEGDIGRAALGRFRDIEQKTPVIVTSSQMMTTGVDVPTCRNVAIVRNIGSMTEFKQIIGRGTRVREDQGKLFFNILDYTGAAVTNFADPEFDGDPVAVTSTEIDDEGEVKESSTEVTDVPPGEEDAPVPDGPDGPAVVADAPVGLPRKYYIDDHPVEVAGSVVFDLDADGRRLRMVQLADYAGEKVRSLWRTADEFRAVWSDLDSRAVVLEELGKRGIELSLLAEAANQPEADPFDLMAHLAFKAPIRTRRERAQRLRDQPDAFLSKYCKDAREVLAAMLDKYAEHGTDQFTIPDILEVPPISEFGNVIEIAKRFGGADQLRKAVGEMQKALYAA